MAPRLRVEQPVQSDHSHPSWFSSSACLPSVRSVVQMQLQMHMQMQMQMQIQMQMQMQMRMQMHSKCKNAQAT